MVDNDVVALAVNFLEERIFLIAQETGRSVADSVCRVGEREDIRVRR